MEPKLRTILLAVSDLGRATSFYEEGLGLTPERKAGALTSFEMGGVTLALVPTRVVSAVMGIEDAEPSGSTVLGHPVRSREEVDALLSQAEAAGARILKTGAENDFGGYNGCFEDPDGHIWNVGFNVHFFRS